MNFDCLKKKLYFLGGLFFPFFLEHIALASQPEPWQVWYQSPSSPVMESIASLHDFIAWIMVGVVVLVFVLLGYVVYRFSERRNPSPATFSHNLPLEIVWTAIPVAILIVIAIPSFRLST